MKRVFYSACHHDGAVWKRSSSGGAFTAITDAWFEAHGEKAVVYGCAMDGALQAVHIRATTAEERNAMCGSKYIGSNAAAALKQAAADLKDGMYVCFSGTPCQIAALKSVLKALRVDSEGRLVTVEVICHGVGSTRFFGDYIANLERKYGSKAISCGFRGKSRPGKKQDMHVTFANGRVYHAPSTNYDWFYTAYLRNLILRPSCFHCPFAQSRRQADIAIADHWEQTQGQQARSLAFATTQQGVDLLDRALQTMDNRILPEEQVYQPQLRSPVAKPESYQAFWEVYLKQGYMAAQKWLGNNTVKGRLKTAAVTALDKSGLVPVLKKVKVRIAGG